MVLRSSSPAEFWDPRSVDGIKYREDGNSRDFTAVSARCKPLARFVFLDNQISRRSQRPSCYFIEPLHHRTFYEKNVFQNKHRCIVIAKRSIRCSVLFPPLEDAAPESVTLAQVLSLLLGQLEQCLPTALREDQTLIANIACAVPNTALIQYHP